MAGLERFVDAQAPVIDRVLAELRAAQKRSHWMWFIFPQLRALGRSDRALFYGLADLAEAEAYLAHPVLGSRLLECTEATISGHPRTAHEIFASPDDMKFRSCMTLFSQVPGAAETFNRAIDLFYDAPDPATLELLRGAGSGGGPA